jgi:tetratricopeptide (TPR) repeat protein
MRVCRGLLWCFLLSLGCQSLPGVDAADDSASPLGRPKPEALLQGPAEQTFKIPQPSPSPELNQARNHLSLAAACLEKGNQAAAAPHLAQYVAAFPDHFVVRAHYAELLLRLNRHREAREQFEHFVADVQDVPALASRHLIHCHSRLMEIAEVEGNEYGEHLNRGIGLFLLAGERARLTGVDEKELGTESLLCRAAGQLTLARMERPDEARPCWYLYAVWSRLAQRQPAVRYLRRADASAPFSYLTPAEKRNLQTAFLSCEAELRKSR